MQYGEYIGWLAYEVGADVARLECAYHQMVHTPLDGWHEAEDQPHLVASVLRRAEAMHPQWRRAAAEYIARNG